MLMDDGRNRFRFRFEIMDSDVICDFFYVPFTWETVRFRCNLLFISSVLTNCCVGDTHGTFGWAKSHYLNIYDRNYR